MSAKSSSNNPLLLMLLLLLLPAHDGVERSYLSAIYKSDLEQLITRLRLNIELDPTLDLPSDNANNDDKIENDETVFDSNTAAGETIEKGSVNNSNDENAANIANNEFSLARKTCGLNTLSADTELTAIALNHANYIKHVFANSKPTRFSPHYQNDIADIATVTGNNNPSFSGLDLKNRLFNADYSNINYGITENIAQTMYYHSAGDLISPTTATLSMAKSLLAAPYHLRSLMAASSEVVGTAMVAYKPFDKESRTNQGYVLVSNAAGTSATRNATFSGVFTYPCQGVNGTVTGLYNETPDPVKHTGRNLGDDPIGQPIYINVPEARNIQLANINFYDVKRAIKLPTQVLSYQNDPYKDSEFALPKNEAFILPITDQLNSCNRLLKKEKNCGLHGNSEYQVSFDIIINNQRTVNQSFSFMTGEVNYS